MGDEENNPGDKIADPAQSNESTGVSEAPAAKTEAKEQSLGDRKNAAKAFYRALYSGEDVVPDDFGIGTKADKQAAPTGPCPNCTRFEAEAKESEKKASDNENFYKRIAADFENYRRRNDREREEAVGLGIQKAIESILPALDDLDRAKTSLATVSDPKAVVESLNLVFARFTKCLEPLGIKTMEVVGERFDPKFHEPVQEIKTTYFEDGAVAQELRRGYIMREKVIRPALVNVASNESGIITPMPTAIEQPAEPDAQSTETRGSTSESAYEVLEAIPETEARGTATDFESQSPVDAVDAQSEQGTQSTGATPSSDNGQEQSSVQSRLSPSGDHAEKNGKVFGSEFDSDSDPALNAETEMATADQAARKQRAANALERLRKPNPKSTAELPAFRSEQSENDPETDEDPQPVTVSTTGEIDSAAEKNSDEEEATKHASSNSD